MSEQFPNIEDVNYKEVTTTAPPFKMMCSKHGELHPDYAFRVNMPDQGYDRKTYCLVCAIEYLSMIANEVEFVTNEEKAE
jgi:hypothetical protein